MGAKGVTGEGRGRLSLQPECVLGDDKVKVLFHDANGLGWGGVKIGDALSSIRSRIVSRIRIPGRARPPPVMRLVGVGPFLVLTLGRTYAIAAPRNERIG